MEVAMFSYLLFVKGATDKEIRQDKKQNICYAELGQLLAAFIPCETIVDDNWGEYHTNCPNNWLVYLANTLFEFYSECEKDKSLYNENYFLSTLSKKGYFIPQSRFYFDETLNKKVVEYLLNQKTEYQNKIDYIVATAYELVQRKITLNRCKECGKWFVAHNKIDTLYCPYCAKERTKRRKANEQLERKIIHNCAQNQVKYLNVQCDVSKHKPDTKTATLSELKEYGEWLKKIGKHNFPKMKTEEQ